jgi:hypothetical protein
MNRVNSNANDAVPPLDLLRSRLVIDVRGLPLALRLTEGLGGFDVEEEVRSIWSCTLESCET